MRYSLLPLLLLLLASCGRADRMRHMLEQAEWMNQHDSLFTSDSVGRALVRYYDHWWHPADLRLRAYYMLGCAYRDMGEAPAAIHYYTIATEKADTAHADSATYATLFRVYGQMAMIYGQQNMPEEELEALNCYSRYAWLAKDTISYILSFEHMTIPYYMLDDSCKVLEITRKTSELYMEYGLPKRAASVYPTAIYVSLLNGNYPRAHEFMEIFESESGLFDEQGNIQPGREHYYNSKGLYYLGIGKLDSAEYFFRRLQSYGYQLEATEGLLSIYEVAKNADSIVKYAHYYQDRQIDWADTRQSDAIIQSSAMYNYERNQNLAERRAKQVQVAWFLLVTISLTLILTIALFYIIHDRIRRNIRKKEEEYNFLEEKYNNNVKEYQQLIHEFTILQQNFDNTVPSIETQELLKGKEERISTLEVELNWYMDKSGALDILAKEEAMKQSNIVKLFQEKSLPGRKWEKPTKNDWDQLLNLYKEFMPLAYSCIIVLSKLQRNTCLLTHMGFPTGTISLLLSTSDQVITNAKRTANSKLAGMKSATTLLQTLRNLAKGVKSV